MYTFQDVLFMKLAAHDFLTSALPKVYRVSRILWCRRYSMQGPVSPDSLSPSSWVRMSSICSRWDGMFVSVTGALSSNKGKHKNVSERLYVQKIQTAGRRETPSPTACWKFEVTLQCKKLQHPSSNHCQAFTFLHFYLSAQKQKHSC